MELRKAEVRKKGGEREEKLTIAHFPHFILGLRVQHIFSFKGQQVEFKAQLTAGREGCGMLLPLLCNRPRRGTKRSEEVMNMLSGDDAGWRSHSLEAVKSSH